MKSMREMMDEMKQMEGEEFDRAFMETMIIHHQQAVEMTDDALKKASSPRIREMAQEMNTKQQTEIDEMKEMLSEM